MGPGLAPLLMTEAGTCAYDMTEGHRVEGPVKAPRPAKHLNLSVFLVGVRTPRTQGLWPLWSQDDHRCLSQSQS